MKYDRQLDLKRTMVVESFAKNGKLGMDAANAFGREDGWIEDKIADEVPKQDDFALE